MRTNWAWIQFGLYPYANRKSKKDPILTISLALSSILLGTLT